VGEILKEQWNRKKAFGQHCGIAIILVHRAKYPAKKEISQTA
jgi:hypothetical protein